jgi:hypothetical protein
MLVIFNTERDFFLLEHAQNKSIFHRMKSPQFLTAGTRAMQLGRVVGVLHTNTLIFKRVPVISLQSLSFK